MAPVVAFLASSSVTRADTVNVSSVADGAGSGNPTVAWQRLTPTVVRSDRTTPILLTVKISGGIPSRIALALPDNTELPLQDNGGGDDAVPGDGIYSVLVPIAYANANLAADDVFRKFVGYIDVYLGNTRVQRANVFSQVWTPHLGIVANVAVDTQLQYSDYIVNIVDPAAFAAGPAADFSAVARRLYQQFGDTFDFLNFVFDTSHIANRYHLAIRNGVSGIGLPLFDGSSLFGSAGRLQGINVFPISGYFDGASSALSHELGHQWINYISGPLFGSVHWPLSTLASGTMGFSLPGSNVGGRYVCKLTAVSGGLQARLAANDPLMLTDLDLYLMGLVPASQVSTHYIFVDQTNALSVPCIGVLPYSMFYSANVNDVIAAVGSRNPPYPVSQREFNVATVVISDSLLTAEAMSYYDWFARRVEGRALVNTHEGFEKIESAPFFTQTGGRGSLNSRFRNALFQPPPISSASRATAVVGTSFAFTFAATGAPDPTVTVTGPMPPGVSYDVGLRTLLGSPSTPGTYALTVRAANGVSPDVTQSFLLTIDLPCVAFVDVVLTDPFCGSVEWMKNRGVTVGCSAGLYCPNNEVNRLAMSSFMGRLGLVLSPQPVMTEFGLTALDPDVLPVVCVTDAIPPRSSTRRAQIDALFTALASASTVVALQIVESDDDGLTWTPLTNAVPAEMQPGRWTSARALADTSLPAGTSRRLALRVGRVNGTAVVSDAYCRVRAVVRN